MIIIIGEFFLNTNSCAPLVLRRFAESHELNMKAEGLASDSENEVAIFHSLDLWSLG